MVVPTDLIREQLGYNPCTGELTWLVHRQKVRPGTVAGTLDKSTGYRQVRVGGKIIYAHRLAWLLATGEWPESRIDHKNGAKDDNRFCNLREATPTQNAYNSKVRSDSPFGKRGVTFDKERGKYTAHIKVDGKSKRLGRWDNIEDADMAYMAAQQRHFGAFVWRAPT